MPKPLTIAVDVRDLRVAKTGTKTYLEELCKEFKKMNSDELHFHFLDTCLPVYTGNIKLFKLMAHANFQLWKQLILPLKAFFKNCDIVFCTDNFVPLMHLGYKTIPVFHDAFVYETPEHYGKLWLQLFKKTALPAAKRSPFIITPTAYAKKQINHLMHIPGKKLVVIHEGPKRFNNDEIGGAEQLLQTLPLNPANYILHVGAMYKRKNLVALVNAFSEIKKLGYPELKLVLAGSLLTHKSDNDYELILDAVEKRGLKSEVIITGYLNDQQLGQLYKNALMYVFPSLNEGFGLPVLEAFEHDLPVLVANNTCLPEVGGDAVVQFNPFDTNDMFEKMLIVLKDPDLRENMISKGQKRLKQFSWHKTALEIIEVFKKAV